MGGDQGPFVVVEAVVAFLTKYSDVRIILVGSSIACEFFSASCSCPNIKERVELMLCSVQVDDSEKPTVSLRNKRDSSMAKVIELVALGDAHACVSAGNTGTMMSFGKRILKTLPGITRPAICASMPTLKPTIHPSCGRLDNQASGLHLRPTSAKLQHYMSKLSVGSDGSL